MANAKKKDDTVQCAGLRGDEGSTFSWPELTPH